MTGSRFRSLHTAVVAGGLSVAVTGGALAQDAVVAPPGGATAPAPMVSEPTNAAPKAAPRAFSARPIFSLSCINSESVIIAPRCSG